MDDLGFRSRQAAASMSKATLVAVCTSTYHINIGGEDIAISLLDNSTGFAKCHLIRFTMIQYSGFITIFQPMQSGLRISSSTAPNNMCTTPRRRPTAQALDRYCKTSSPKPIQIRNAMHPGKTGPHENGEQLRVQQQSCLLPHLPHSPRTRLECGRPSLGFVP
jgi:hypothetical protein